MKDINKILIFLTFALIYSSIVYIVSQPTEFELDISNAMINDLVLNPKYTDETYVSGWNWESVEKNGTVIDYNYVYESNDCNNISINKNCRQHKFLSNQTLNGTTHIRVKTQLNGMYALSLVNNQFR